MTSSNFGTTTDDLVMTISVQVLTPLTIVMTICAFVKIFATIAIPIFEIVTTNQVLVMTMKAKVMKFLGPKPTHKCNIM